ncbi:MAG TPA: hypothetical protein H9768_02765 [Candidatus Mailhella merdavium]|nr:hypothetical protein [Candidatus Mailhella merdavium]
MIRITAKRDGFRRAGMAHDGTKDWPDGTFTPEQLAALKDETMLTVEEIREIRTPEKKADRVKAEPEGAEA